MKLQAILSRLEKVSGGNGRWRARCPAHGSTGLTLAIKDAGDDRTLVHCFAGCEAAEVMSAIGLQVKDLYPDEGDWQRPVLSPDQELKARLFVEMAKVKRKLSEDDRKQAIRYAQQLKEQEAS